MRGLEKEGEGAKVRVEVWWRERERDEVAWGVWVMEPYLTETFNNSFASCLPN